jgi:diadenosine tetraphosphatase ApaH/serine/threonine PP2A family protein phosphatase
MAAMKLALITDIHANREAFTAVLDDARMQGAQRYALLGDFVGYGADPGWVVDRVMQMAADGAVAVVGNHDAATVRGTSPSMRPEPRMGIEWTRLQLDEPQLAFLAGLPYTVAEDDRLYVHANAHAPSEWGYITTRTDAALSLHATASHYVFCGHVHEQRLYNLSPTGKTGEFQPTANVPIPVPPHRHWLALPGSTGQPRDGDPAAAYALFDIDTAMITFRRVPYDHDSAAAKIRAAGLPASFADRLLHGE